MTGTFNACRLGADLISQLEPLGGEVGVDKMVSLVLFPKRPAKPSELAQMACHIVENFMLNGKVIRLDGAIRMSMML